MCTFGLSGCGVKPRQFRDRHFFGNCCFSLFMLSRPRSFKHHQYSTKRPPRQEERKKIMAEEGKKKNAKFWASHPLWGPHPLGSGLKGVVPRAPLPGGGFFFSISCSLWSCQKTKTQFGQSRLGQKSASAQRSDWAAKELQVAKVQGFEPTTVTMVSCQKQKTRFLRQWRPMKHHTESYPPSL